MRRPEQALHLAAAQYLRLALRPPTLWFTLDAGAGRMAPAAAGLLKARGGVRGLPDLMVMHPGLTGPVVCGLEVKAPKGRASQAQLAMREAFEAAHAAYAFVRSVDEVEAQLRQLGIPVFASVGPRGSVWGRAA